MAKYTIELGPKAEETLKRLADAHETSKADAIRRSVAVFAALTEEVQRGHKIMLKAEDGTIRELFAA
jgi:predicted transcriptional regulator